MSRVNIDVSERLFESLSLFCENAVKWVEGKPDWEEGKHEPKLASDEAIGYGLTLADVQELQRDLDEQKAIIASRSNVLNLEVRKPKDWEANEWEAFRKGRMIEFIRSVRANTGSGLRESREYYNRMKKEIPEQFGIQNPDTALDLTKSTGEFEV